MDTTAAAGRLFDLQLRLLAQKLEFEKVSRGRNRMSTVASDSSSTGSASSLDSTSPQEPAIPSSGVHKADHPIHATVDKSSAPRLPVTEGTLAISDSTKSDLASLNAITLQNLHFQQLLLHDYLLNRRQNGLWMESEYSNVRPPRRITSLKDESCQTEDPVHGRIAHEVEQKDGVRITREPANNSVSLELSDMRADGSAPTENTDKASTQQVPKMKQPKAKKNKWRLYVFMIMFVNTLKKRVKAKNVRRPQSVGMKASFENTVRLFLRRLRRQPSFGSANELIHELSHQGTDLVINETSIFYAAKNQEKQEKLLKILDGMLSSVEKVSMEALNDSPFVKFLRVVITPGTSFNSEFFWTTERQAVSLTSENRLYEIEPAQAKMILIYLLFVKMLIMGFLLVPIDATLVKAQNLISRNNGVVAFVLYRIVRGACAKLCGESMMEIAQEFANVLHPPGSQQTAIWTDLQWRTIYRRIESYISSSENRLLEWANYIYESIKPQKKTTILTGQ